MATSGLALFPARVKFVNADGTLTNEAYRALQQLFIRVGGSLGNFDFNSLALSGSATIGGTLGLSSGTAALPSLYWGGNTSTGFYRIAANNVGYSVSGVNLLSLSSTGLTVTGVTTSTSFSGSGTGLTGTAPGLTAGNVTTNANLTGMVTSVGNATTVVTNANLTGEVTSTGNATTVTNSAVIGKVLTGYVSGAGTVAATDTILQAIQKLNGNNATNANLTGPITSVGNATSVAAQTGTGSTFVMQASPTLTTPNIGVATGTSLATTLQVASTSAGALTVPSISARFNASNFRIGFGIANSNGFGYVGLNANPKAGSDTTTYDINGAAAQIQMHGNQYVFNLAASGTAGTDITFTTAATLTQTRLTLPGAITLAGGATLLTTSTALTNGSGVAAGTLTNSPIAGNPTKWIGISDNGTTRYIPAW